MGIPSFSRSFRTGQKRAWGLVFTSGWLIAASAQIVYGDYWAGGRVGKTDCKISAYYDSSVATFGYTGTYDSARAAWGGISSKVSIGKTTSKTGNPDIYYVANDPTGMNLGRTYPYVQGASGPVQEDNTTADWVYCTVYSYDNVLKASSATAADKTMNATHEIGHTLKQAHPSTSQTSVMNQGLPSLNANVAASPTTYDKGELKAKWGN